MVKAIIKMLDPEGNRVAVPVRSEDHAARLIASGWKPNTDPDQGGESYAAAKKRNYPVLEPVRFAGSVRFFTSRSRF